MSKTMRKFDKIPRLQDSRSQETLTALLHCKGGPMRDRRERKPSEEKRRHIEDSMYEDCD